MAKNLALFFDGTWGRADPVPWRRTNCRTLFEMVMGRDLHGSPQRAWYDEGVGVRWYERIQGGIFGSGLDLNVRQGYKWLARNYREGDRIYLFGFSRGAYTARSLAGLVRKCGLPRAPLLDDLEHPHEPLLSEAYRIYRNRDEHPDTPEALEFCERYAQRVKIRMIGVFDTVGSLGIPSSLERVLEGVGLEHLAQWIDRDKRRRYEFHDHALSAIVENAFHALAIDEHREVFWPTLWEDRHHAVQRIEQVWFAGCHTDIGGGYPDRGLANVPLAWMRHRARECGLQLEVRYPMQGVTGFETLHDSWNRAPYHLRPRLLRPLDVGELHESVLERYARNHRYRPENLLARLSAERAKESREQP